jgi:hypothetical protein
MPRGDDNNTDVLLYAGVGAIAAGLAWAFWPRTADAPSLHSYAPAPTEAPVTMPAFLAVAPPAGAARERYFEAAVDAPTWVRVALSPQLSIDVTSDVLKAQGNRIPLWPSTSQRIADRLNAMLPTKTISDAIWRAGTVKIAPRSMQPREGVSRDSNRLLAEHNAIIDAQVAGRTGLIVGQKKDQVVGRSLETVRNKVFLYGWHDLSGRPVQPMYGGHSLTYGADYAHGTRIVSKVAYLNGQPVAIESLFANPQYAPLLYDNGTLGPAALRYPTSP